MTLPMPLPYLLAAVKHAQAPPELNTSHTGDVSTPRQLIDTNPAAGCHLRQAETWVKIACTDEFVSTKTMSVALIALKRIPEALWVIDEDP